MMTIEHIQNHKGTWCWFRRLFCQEGYCRGCQVYVELLLEVQDDLARGA